MKKITINEKELRSIIREILSEQIATTDLTNPGVTYGFATTDLRNVLSRASDNISRDDSDTEPMACGESYSINDINSPEWPQYAANKFRAGS